MNGTLEYRDRQWRDERAPRRTADVVLVDGPSAGRRFPAELGPPYALHVPYVEVPPLDADPFDPAGCTFGQTTYDLRPTTAEGRARYGVEWVGVSGLPRRRGAWPGR